MFPANEMKENNIKNLMWSYIGNSKYWIIYYVYLYINDYGHGFEHLSDVFSDFT